MIYHEIVERAFTSLRLESITILLAHSRTKIKGIFRLCLQPDGEVNIEGARFQRFRLYAPNKLVREQSV